MVSVAALLRFGAMFEGFDERMPPAGCVAGQEAVVRDREVKFETQWQGRHVVGNFWGSGAPLGTVRAEGACAWTIVLSALTTSRR